MSCSAASVLIYISLQGGSQTRDKDKPVKFKFSVGQKVAGRCIPEQNLWYHAKIVAAYVRKGKPVYIVSWADGDKRDTVKNEGELSGDLHLTYVDELHEAKEESPSRVRLQDEIHEAHRLIKNGEEAARKPAREARDSNTSKATHGKRPYAADSEEDGGARGECDNRGSHSKRQRNVTRNHAPVGAAPVGAASSVDACGHVAVSRSASVTAAQVEQGRPYTRSAARAASLGVSGSTNVLPGSVPVPSSGENRRAHVSIQPCHAILCPCLAHHTTPSLSLLFPRSHRLANIRPAV